MENEIKEIKVDFEVFLEEFRSKCGACECCTNKHKVFYHDEIECYNNFLKLKFEQKI